MLEVTGKTVLVTGAAKRIGRVIALSLASGGADVIVHCNTSIPEARDVVERIEKSGRRAWTIQADLKDPAGVESLFDSAIERAGRIDAIVNSASIFPSGTLAESGIDDFLLNLKLNALSPFVLARRLAGEPGEACVVNLLDSRITDYDSQHVPYHVSKRVLFDLTRMMSIEFAPRLRVNGVAPGLILPPPGESVEYLEKLKHTNPLNRIGSPEDIAAAVMFLVTSPFVTGQVIFVDGGRHMKGSMYGI